jgi:hypothetical protein
VNRFIDQSAVPATRHDKQTTGTTIQHATGRADPPTSR